MGRPGSGLAEGLARPATEPEAESDDVFECRTWFEGLLGVPATEGNRVEILRNGDRIFFAMLEAAEAAEKTIDFASFNFGGSIAHEFAQVLSAKAREGVRVRILLDRMGSMGADRTCLDHLRRAGASVEWFRPLGNPRIWETFHRGHRKVLICDRRVAFTGGVGVDDRWLGDARTPDERRDTHFRVRGPAVDGVHGAFVNNWAETGLPLFDETDDFEPQPAAGFSTVQVVRAGARTGWGDIATLMGVLLTFARKRLRIGSAYFVPDKHVLAMLCEAAGRGVQVQVLVNGAHSDKWISRLATQGQYDKMLEAGIEVWCYEPTMLHLKQITIDGIAASVGSANLNARSMMQDEELNLAIFDPVVVQMLDDHFDDDLAHAERVDAARWSSRSRTQKALELVPSVIARHL